MCFLQQLCMLQLYTAIACNHLSIAYTHLPSYGLAHNVECTAILFNFIYLNSIRVEDCGRVNPDLEQDLWTRRAVMSLAGMYLCCCCCCCWCYCCCCWWWWQRFECTLSIHRLNLNEQAKCWVKKTSESMSSTNQNQQQQHPTNLN